MASFSEKVYLSLKMPAEDAPLSDQQRILLALQTLGYAPVTMPLPVIQKLYPLCRRANFDITVTLVRRQADWVITDLEPSDTTIQHYGLAVDYGSTTIVMALVDLRSGKTLAQSKAVNGQTAYGTDILSRITYAMEDPAHLEKLQRATVQTMNLLLAQLTRQSGIETSTCPVMILSGNTTMIHFLLKLDAWSVFAAPYAPVAADPGFFWGRELGIAMDGVVYIVPAASNYIGGDIVSGLLTLDLQEKEEPSLFFDIGTNGELVIGNKDWLLAGAGAAGPALEGYISENGMRAAPGAIDHVYIRGNDLRFTTIDGEKPVGICGSGIIDLMAQMRRNGWINIAGELEPQASARIVYLPQQRQYAVAYALAEEAAHGQALLFTQTDIHQYLDTKAAAYTMVECLLETAGIEAQMLGKCYLSGAFAAHSDLESAITIGMFPDLPREKFAVRANTSLDGAKKLLLERQLLQEVEWILQQMYCVQLASYPDFLVRMQAAKFVPHTDLGRYPSAQKWLSALEGHKVDEKR